MRPRDSQRSKVWGAIHAWEGRYLPMSPGLRKWFKRRIENDRWFRRHFRDNWPLPDERRGMLSEERYLVVVAWYLRPRLSSTYAMAGESGTWHGWQFCATLLLLANHFLGKESAARLRKEFKLHRVRYTRPRKRAPRLDMSDIEKRAWADKMAIERVIAASKRVKL
jgi:hypothetical protein